MSTGQRTKRAGAIHSAAAAVLLASLSVAVLFCYAGWSGATRAPHGDAASRPASSVTGDRPMTVRPIEDVRVGDRVIGQHPNQDIDTSLGTKIDPDAWKQLTLRAVKRDGSQAHIVLLRPGWWIDAKDAHVNREVYVPVPECGIEGNSLVLSVEPCPPIQPGSDPIVTGTFRHSSAQVIDIRVDGFDETIGTTANHPIWSEDRASFVRADSLRSGERIRALAGFGRVQNITRRAQSEPVFNLEVFGQHVYHVGGAGWLVHNGSALFDWRKYESLVLDELGVPKNRRRPDHRQVERVTRYGRRILDGLSADGRHAYEITQFDFRFDFDAPGADPKGNMRQMFANKLAQLEKDAFALQRGDLDRVTIVTADNLPLEGRGAEYTRRILELRKDPEIGKRLQWRLICPGDL